MAPNKVDQQLNKLYLDYIYSKKKKHWLVSNWEFNHYNLSSSTYEMMNQVCAYKINNWKKIKWGIGIEIVLWW